VTDLSVLHPAAPDFPFGHIEGRFVERSPSISGKRLGSCRFDPIGDTHRKTWNGELSTFCLKPVTNGTARKMPPRLQCLHGPRKRGSELAKQVGERGGNPFPFWDLALGVVVLGIAASARPEMVVGADTASSNQHRVIQQHSNTNFKSNKPLSNTNKEKDSMKRFMNKKVATIGVAAGLALGLGGAAFAYFSSTGAGNGSASVGTTGNNVAVEGASTPALVPGETTSMSFTAYNYSAFNQAIQHITLTGVVACTAAFTAPVATDNFGDATTAPSCPDAALSQAATNDAACVAGGAGTTNTNWFSMPVVTLNDTNSANGDLAPGGPSSPAGQALTPTGTITMNDLHVNQDACQGLNLDFEFTTS
jgi:hypothetical protein